MVLSAVILQIKTEIKETKYKEEWDKQKKKRKK